MPTGKRTFSRSKARKPAKSKGKSASLKKTHSHATSNTPKLKASQRKKTVRKAPVRSAPKRDASGRFVSKVKKNVTKEKFKKAGLPYRPKKPHSRAKKRPIVKKARKYKVVQLGPTQTDSEGKKKPFIPNQRSDPFRTAPQTNPDTKVRFDPESIWKEVHQSLETELDGDVTGNVKAVIDHGGFLFHEYFWHFPDFSVQTETLTSLYEVARPFLRPFYRSLTALIAQVGFEHEERKITALAFRQLAGTLHFDNAFTLIPISVERWGQSTNYRAITGIAIHVKAPDWMQPKDKQILEHKKVIKRGTKSKRVRATKGRHKVSKISPKLHTRIAKKKLPRGSVKNPRGKRTSAKGNTRQTNKTNPRVKK